MATRILLVDDHSLVRSGLRMLLEQIDGWEVVAEAGDGRKGVQLAFEEHPDVVIMDIGMPELNGLDATHQIKQRHPEMAVILLSMYSGDEYVATALEHGADAYLVKDAAEVELELAIQAVLRGESYLSPVIAKRLVQLQSASAQRTVPKGRDLTPRQREILQLIAEGNTTKGIAQKLGLSAKTVEAHRAQLMQRLDIRDIAGLVRYAVRTGLVTAD